MAEAPEFLNTLLKQIAQEQNFINYTLKVKPISSGGANYSSTLYEITFTEDGKDVYMFAKVAAMGDKLRQYNPNMYKTESFVYSKLSKVFEGLENRYQVPQEHRLTFSKFYGCNDKQYEEIMVLENLVKSGYESFDRFQNMSKEYAFSALRELAKFHALSYAYAEYYPQEFKDISGEFKSVWDSDGGMIELVFKNGYKKAIATVRDELKRPFQKYFDSLTMKTLDEYVMLSYRPVLAHGDYRPNNLMHRNNDDGTVDIKILDLQTMYIQSPIVDVIYFIFTGSDDKFRAQYFDQLIDHYYTQLHAAMKRLHLDPEKIFSRANFDKELKEKLPLGLIFSMILLPLVTVEEENAPEVNEDLDETNFIVEETSDLYVERLNGVVSEYIKWGILK